MLEMKNPCVEIPIVVSLPTPFSDHIYSLGDEVYSQSVLISDIATSPTEVDCGPMVVDYFFEDGSNIDSSIFNVDSSTSA